MISKKILSIVTIILAFFGLIPLIIQNSYFLGLWLFSLIIVVIIWCYELLQEWSHKLIFDKLYDESFRNEFFMSFIRERKAIRETNDENIIVSNIFGHDDITDYLKFYLYIIIKKSKISILKSEFLSSNEMDKIFESNLKGEIKDEISYPQIYSLRGDWEMGVDILDREYNGKITFKILLKFDKNPVNSLQKKILLHNIENDLDGLAVQKIIKNLLLNAEDRELIKSLKTLSRRTFGKLFYITYKYADEPPEKDPFG